MYAKVTSLGVTGLAGYIVQVEADLSGGLPQFNLVGLPDSAVKESSERVRSAIKNLHYEWPASRITINLAPADVRKTGPVYDLPVFVGIMAAQDKLPAPGSERAFLGELGLDGTLRPVTGVLPMALAAVQNGVKELFLPAENAAEAAAFLANTEGSILLTTGSKELAAYSGILDFTQRVYARVLPMDASLEACRTAGLKASHIIAMQGPFSEEMDLATLRFANAAWMVTKDGGEAGGFPAKVSAARKAGVGLVVIGRPPQRGGIPFAAVLDVLCKRFGCTVRPQVRIVGIGPGSREAMTREVSEAIETADCLIGAKRMLDAVARPGQPTHDAIAPQDIADFIRAHREYRRFAVVMSGDTGFFSGTKKLLPLLEGCDRAVLPGLSSLSYLCARLQTSYEDVRVVSLHGRQHNILPEVRANGRLFALVGGERGINDLCRTLTAGGLGGVTVSVGQRLGYPDERIVCGTAAELAEGAYAPLSVALIENPHPYAVVTPGLPDDVFLRSAEGMPVVPMTKSEVRAVCLSKLRLTERSVCWDIGAGTGSVSVEMALQAKRGLVCAVERREDAAALLEQNRERFALENLRVVCGSAPEACAGLPAPTHAFIGGSAGNMREIVALLLARNPRVRIVATTVSLESIAELTDCLTAFPFAETEVVSLQVARDRRAGGYHLMSGQNPIYIFTMQGGGETA